MAELIHDEAMRIMKPIHDQLDAARKFLDELEADDDDNDDETNNSNETKKMIPRNVIKKSDVQAAAEYIVANSLPNNSTKYDAELTIDGVVHRVAP